jgi:hypothetical protein
MHDSPPDLAYHQAFIEPLAQGEGACAFFASDPEGQTSVVSCTYHVEDDAFGDALRDPSTTVRASAAVRALLAAREFATGAGFRPLPGR